MIRMIYGPEFTRMMMSVSSIGHVLAFDRRGWSIMMRMRARGWLLWKGQCGRTLGMKKEVPSMRHGVAMSTALFNTFSTD